MTGSGWHVTIPGGPWGCLCKKTADIFICAFLVTKGSILAMNIILLSSFCKKKGSIDICVPSAMTWLLPGMALFSIALLWAGYELGIQRAGSEQIEAAEAEIRGIIDQGRQQLEVARVEQQAHLDALALRMAKLQAHLMRLDALGERLVGVGKLDAGEFDFSTEPAQGGLDDDPGSSSSAQELVADLNRIEQLLADRESKLSMLENELANRELIRESVPSGRPVDKGWISSTYGKRIDPMTGKRRMHHGIDFAGVEGAPVHAVAAGVVIRSGKGNGYGNLVEIRHPDGYTTVYAHNEKNLVKPGDLVAKGQVVAQLGSTGRSTGPHVHFEVRRKGRNVNPGKFIRAP